MLWLKIRTLETLIDHYDRPDAFFYLDPPYYSTESMYDVAFEGMTISGSGYAQGDQREISSVLQ